MHKHFLYLAAFTLFGCQTSGNPASTSPPSSLEPSGVITADTPEESTAPPATPQGPDDWEISAAVRREMLFDQSIPTTAVSVDTTAGVVELTGTVPHLLAKERATRKAEVVKGVRAVSNRLRVIPVPRTDEEIEQDIERALLWNPTAESYESDVRVDNQVVSLHGTVDSWAERDMVERIAKSVRGVADVQSKISISTKGKRADEEIEQDVRSRMRWDALVDDGPLKVDVANGVVELSGAVASLAEKRRARADAWVMGARAVDDSAVEVQWNLAEKMRREGTANPRPHEIEAAISAAAMLDPRIPNPTLIKAEADDNAVTLTGTVKTLRARRAMYELAHNTVGVDVVIDELEVAPKKVQAKKLRKRIDLALAINPVTSSGKVDVATTAGGAVTLTGQVDNFAESAEAADVAANVAGVESVTNRLQVVDPTYGFYYDAYAYPYYPFIGSWKDYAPQQTRTSDEDLEAAIEREIAWSPWVSGATVDVSVEAGVATLTGTVDGSRGHDAAIENAVEGGAIAIVDKLDVRWY